MSARSGLRKSRDRAREGKKRFRKMRQKIKILVMSLAGNNEVNHIDTGEIPNKFENEPGENDTHQT